MRAALALFLVLVATCPAAADQPAIPEALEPGETHRVVAVIDGDTLVLDDGREVRLVGLQAPKLPLGRPDFEPWPLADEAKAVLAALAKGREVTLAYGGRRIDRHQRVLAHLFRGDGLWLQAALLRRGLARVYSFADNRTLVARLLAIEAEARNAERGIWRHPYYQVRHPHETDDLIGSFQLVQGRVRDSAEVRGRVYLNYGRDWRRDFTVTLAPDVVELFRAEGLDPLAYAGRVIRVRGWIESYNGPMIEVTHPEQIEVKP